MGDTQPTLLDCGHTESPHSDITSGFGLDKDGKKHCYTCCAEWDKAQMRKDGRISLYLVFKPLEHEPKELRPWVVNWPASLKIPVSGLSISKHNWNLKRRDFWFWFEGVRWHGYQIGEHTQIAHCRKTKYTSNGKQN